jgi:exopolysaccharide biosynthesis polyprenyl glycosylphosphotransferase
VVGLRTLADDRRTRAWRRYARAHWTELAAGLGLLPALRVAVHFGGVPRGLGAGLTVLAAWAAWSLAASGRRDLGPRDHLVADVRSAGVLASVTGVAVVAGVLGVPAARAAFAVLATAALATWLLRAVHPRVVASRRVVLVGTRDDVEAYLGGRGEDVVAGCYILDGGTALPVSDRRPLPTTTSLETLPELVASAAADMVLVLPGPGVTPDVVRRLSWAFDHTSTKVGVVCPVAEVSQHRIRARVAQGTTVLEVGVPRAGLLSRVVKGLIDRLGALVLLVLVSPVLLVLWLAVRLDSEGPGVFVQTRVGVGGRTFRMFKLRSMHCNAEAALDALLADNESDGALFKIRRDPRVTRVGYWLRRSSLDELPQLFNVLRGEMSLVGPRPALPSEVATYDETARRRLVVKPGITGLWQVSGRADLLWDESLRLDLYYADNWRLVDDFSIAARTLRAVTQARGAY